MTRSIIESSKAPSPVGPYSQAVSCGSILFISGQIPLDPESGELNNETIEQEVNQVFDNIEAVLAENNKSINDVKKFTVYLTDLVNTPLVNAQIEKRVSEPFPARTTIQVSALPMGSRVEIECLG